jgi:2',3'-cyclic-nucleotide 3'-phosphodiesterase
VTGRISADGAIDEEKLKEVEKAVKDAGVDLAGDSELGGWTGGVVWLVPTDASIADWKPIATKVL